MSLDTFLGAFLGVALGEVCKILFDRYARHRATRSLDSAEAKLREIRERIKSLTPPPGE